MASYDEMMKGQADRYDPKADSVRTEKGIESNTQGMNMKITAPANETSLNKAVSHLNKQVRS